MSDFDAVCDEGERISREEGYRVMQAEIASLHAEIERLRITDAEREAVQQAFDFVCGMERPDAWAVATLRNLLKRMTL